MSLLDPFSGNEIPLPHQNTFPGYLKDYALDEYAFIQKMVLSSSPSKSSDFILMVIAGDIGDLGFWRLGNKAWNKIKKLKGVSFTDVVYYGDGQFYAIGNPGRVWVFKIDGNDNHIEGRMIVHCETIVPDFTYTHPNITYVSYNLYILKTVDDRLFMITRSSPDLSQDGLYYTTSKFQVYEVDLATGEYKEIHSLGCMAVFLGENSTIAVDTTRFSGEMKMKANHIYFTDDVWEFNYLMSSKGGGKNIGIYDLETGTIEPIHLGDRVLSLTRFSTPVWISPCL